MTSILSASTISSIEDSQWKKLVAIHFKSNFDDEKAAVAVEQVHVEAEKMMEIPEEEDEDDDTEELCNRTFTLAYGTKFYCITIK